MAATKVSVDRAAATASKATLNTRDPRNNTAQQPTVALKASNAMSPSATATSPVEPSVMASLPPSSLTVAFSLDASKRVVPSSSLTSTLSASLTRGRPFLSLVSMPVAAILTRSMPSRPAHGQHTR